MLSLFGFGKKRRSSRKGSKKSKKGSKKPPAKLLKICKKLKVKTTVKRGSKRVYKSKSALKKLCMKKLKALKKKHLKKSTRKVRKGRKGSRRVKSVRSRSSRSRASEFGSNCAAGGMYGMAGNGFGSPSVYFGRKGSAGMEFGKRRRAGAKKASKMSKKQAMTAFKKFFMKYCKRGSRFGGMLVGGGQGLTSGMRQQVRADPGLATAINNYRVGQGMTPGKNFTGPLTKFGRRSRFGNGGNPPLYQSMGGEFCPSGMGGVLGAFGTGLNPTPCTPFSQAQATAEANAAASVQQLVAAQTASAKFGARRRRCTRKKARAGKCTPKRKSRKSRKA